MPSNYIFDNCLLFADFESTIVLNQAIAQR